VAQDAKGQGGFQGRSALADDIDGELALSKPAKQVLERRAPHLLSGKMDLRSDGLCARRIQEDQTAAIPVAAEGFQEGASAEIAPADARHDELVHFLDEFERKLVNRRDPLLCRKREIQPAQEVGARAASGQEGGAGGQGLLGQSLELAGRRQGCPPGESLAE